MTRRSTLRRFGNGVSVHEQALHEEMESHVQLLIDELAEDGMSPEGAAEEAERRFGDLDRYLLLCRSIDKRERRRKSWRSSLEALGSDLRSSGKAILAQPLYSFSVVLTLALAIGMSTMMFSVVDAVLLRPLDVPSPERLLTLREVERDTGSFNSVSPANFTDWRARSESFSKIAALESRQPTLSGVETPERLEAAAVSQDFFSAVAVPPLHGRVFAADDFPRTASQDGASGVVVLSHRFFNERFAGDSKALGNTIILNGRESEIVGVMPEGFELPLDVDLWLPLNFAFDVAGSRGAHYLSAIGRLSEDVSHEAAEAEMDAIARQLEAEHPQTNSNSGIHLSPVIEAQTGSMRPFLLSLLAAVSVVLLIACANVAGLSLVRSVARERELALRTALGAPRGRLARLLVGEASLLTLAGGAGGVALAFAGMKVLIDRVPFDLPRADQVALDGRVLLFSLAVTGFTALLFGIAPVISARRLSIQRVLRENSSVTTGTRGKLRLRQGLVAFELALALVLLSVCGLLFRSLSELSDVDLGFAPEGLLAFQLDLPSDRYSDGREVAFYEQLIEILDSLPEIESTAISPWLPLTSGWMFSLKVVGDPDPGVESRQNANLRMINDDYFDTLGIARQKGRRFSRVDGPNSPSVIIVNQALVDRYLDGRDPIGMELELGYGRGEAAKVPRRIVGVVDNVRHFGPAGPALPTVYASHRQMPFSSMAVAVRTSGEPLALAPQIRDVVKRMDGQLAVDRLQTLTSRYSERLAPRRFLPTLLAVFAAVSVVLTALGLYGVLAQIVATSEPELAVRRALGAEANQILRFVLGRVAILLAVGLSLGLVGAWSFGRLVDSLLFEVEPGDPKALALAISTLILVSAVASLRPVLTACKVDPVRTLRNQ